jgi:uncharacterized Fe-S cluster-containing radical SAM superfamily protein
MKKDSYDFLERAASIETVVCRGGLRKYYRFRPARFYGGIATGDCPAVAFAASFAGHGIM